MNHLIWTGQAEEECALEETEADTDTVEIGEIEAETVEERVKTDKVDANLANKILESPFLHHTEWSESAKATAEAIEVAGLTGLHPKDIRQIVKDKKTGQLILLDSGSCWCIEPASPGLRANGRVDMSYKLRKACGTPLICYGEKQRTIEPG